MPENTLDTHVQIFSLPLKRTDFSRIQVLEDATAENSMERLLDRGNHELQGLNKILFLFRASEAI